MKKFAVVILFLLLLSITIWIAFQRKTEPFKDEKKYQPALTKIDTSFILKRDKVLESVIKSPLYFDAKTQKLTTNKWKVTINLSGDINGAADAADIKLNLSEGLTISELKEGSAFPLYPRKVISNNYILVTGLATIINSKMIFGEPNKIFFEFIVQTTENHQNARLIRIDVNDTKIYLNGESVLDIDKNVSLIDLP